MIKFTIPLPPISKKNSQRIMVNYRTGKPFIMPSEQYKLYEQQALWFIPKGKYITNLLEAIDDIMVKARLLADDNYTVIESHDGSRVLYDKDNPRTEVYIEASEQLQKDTEEILKR